MIDCLARVDMECSSLAISRDVGQVDQQRVSDWTGRIERVAQRSLCRGTQSENQSRSDVSRCAVTLTDGESQKYRFAIPCIFLRFFL